MKIYIQVGQSSGCLTVQREAGDAACKAGGWTDYGWGAEHQLMYRIKKRLNACGFNLIKKRMQSDGHMWGQEATPYLRSASKVRRHPHIYIYDADYALRDSAKDFDAGEEVRFMIDGNIWDGVDQPDWGSIVRSLCKKHGLPMLLDNCEKQATLGNLPSP